MMSVDEGLADRLDAVGDRLPGRPSRQEVLRRLIERHLAGWEAELGIASDAHRPDASEDGMPDPG
jgi:hypothetical protein